MTGARWRGFADLLAAPGSVPVRPTRRQLGEREETPVEILSGLEAHADGDPVPGRTTTKPLEPGKAD
jgi:hypothetical protein